MILCQHGQSPVVCEKCLSPRTEHPPEPTNEQCDAKARLPDFRGYRAYACWYPQMGGYVSNAVVLVRDGNVNDCFEAYVWHDGEFPFGEGDERPPAHIHHCMADQFIRFGEWVNDLMPDRESELDEADADAVLKMAEESLRKK